MTSNFALFENLNKEEVNAILNASQKRVIEPKTVFIEQGSSDDTAYFILEGTVNVYRMDENGNEVSVCILGEGDIVGEMALIDQEPRSTYVATLTTTTLLALSSDNFKTILQKYPTTAIHLLSSLSKRLRNANQQLENIANKSLATRTWNTLQILQRSFKDKAISLTHEELASIVGATRARVTEALNEFEQQGKISLSSKKIKVL